MLGTDHGAKNSTKTRGSLASADSKVAAVRLSTSEASPSARAREARVRSEAGTKNESFIGVEDERQECVATKLALNTSTVDVFRRRIASLFGCHIGVPIRLFLTLICCFLLFTRKNTSKSLAGYIHGF